MGIFYIDVFLLVMLRSLSEILCTIWMSIINITVGILRMPIIRNDSPKIILEIALNMFLCIFFNMMCILKVICYVSCVRGCSVPVMRCIIKKMKAEKSY